MKYLILFLTTFCLPLTVISQTNKAAEAGNQLAFELYNINSKSPGNLFFSPLSIETALAMTTAGAQNETLAQMNKTLHLAPNEHSAFRTLLGQLKGSKDFQLFTANRIWGAKGTDYYPNFLKLLQDNYGTGLTALDFKNQPEASRLKINKWVELQTKDKIKDLLPQGSIGPKTDLVLTNAIYFKGSWAVPFREELTKNDDFEITAQQKKSTAFMHLTSNFKYTENSDLQFLEMRYQGNELVMDILLPKAGTELSSLEKKITSATLEELNRNGSFPSVELSLPKFKAESTLKLNDNLIAMGMPLAFDPDRADFHGMRKILPGENIYISTVIHKAFVDVNEKGTEAAAATAVGMGVAATAMPAPPIVFKANRPFLFFIHHVKSGAILFMGRYSQP